MIKKSILFCMIMLLLVFTGTPLSSQEEIKTKEEVSVVNIEVPVRVFFEGKSIDNLSKSDFKLYEGKKEQEIHGFYRVKRKIKLKGVETPGAVDRELALPSRYFVLVFRVTDYNKELKQGLDYLFKNILRKNDQLLVFANDKTLLLKDLLDKKQAHSLIDQTLREQSLESRWLMTNYLLKIKQLLDQTRADLVTNQARTDPGGNVLATNLLPPSSANFLLDFLTKYLLTWKEYKDRYLVPDMDKYYNFARFLEKIRKEKWVISFYQVEMFPKLTLSGEFRRLVDRSIQAWLMERSEDAAFARKILAQLQLVDRELSAAENFPAEEISKLFYKVGATFHSIFMTVNKEANVRDLEFKSLSTDIENSLREITAKTGGQLMATNDLRSALDTVVEKEDICYMLTYAPDNPNTTGKISVELSNTKYRKYKVIYDKNMREDYIREYLAKKSAQNPDVQLQEVTFKGKKLSMAISDFLMRKTDKTKNSGRLTVHVLIKNSLNQTVFDKKRQIEATKDTITLSLGFGWLRKGEYSVILDVKDLLTGKSTSSFLQPVVN